GRVRMPRRHAHEPAVAAALARHAPLINGEFAVRDAGELQERLMRRELRDEREPLARPEVPLVQRFEVELGVEGERPMPERREQGAIPRERVRGHNDHVACTTGHRKWGAEKFLFPYP